MSGPTHAEILGRLQHLVGRFDEHAEAVEYRLDKIEECQEQLAKQQAVTDRRFAELAGSKKMAFALLGALATVAGLVIAAWKTVFS